MQTPRASSGRWPTSTRDVDDAAPGPPRPSLRRRPDTATGPPTRLRSKTLSPAGAAGICRQSPPVGLVVLQLHVAGSVDRTTLTVPHCFHDVPPSASESRSALGGLNIACCRLIRWPGRLRGFARCGRPPLPAFGPGQRLRLVMSLRTPVPKRAPDGYFGVDEQVVFSSLTPVRNALEGGVVKVAGHVFGDGRLTRFLQHPVCVAHSAAIFVADVDQAAARRSERLRPRFRPAA